MPRPQKGSQGSCVPLVGGTLSEDLPSSHVSNKIRNLLFFLARPRSAGARQTTSPGFRHQPAPSSISSIIRRRRWHPLPGAHRAPQWNQRDSAIVGTTRPPGPMSLRSRNREFSPGFAVALPASCISATACRAVASMSRLASPCRLSLTSPRPPRRHTPFPNTTRDELTS